MKMLLGLFILNIVISFALCISVAGGHKRMRAYYEENGSIRFFWKLCVAPICCLMHFTGVFLKGASCFISSGYWDTRQ